MKSFIEFVTEEQLDEKLLLINNGKRYGQIVFLGGGAGSGKGFAAENFINSEDFRSINIDDAKKLFLAIADKKNKFPEIKGLNQKDPEQANTLHQWVNKLGFRDKALSNILKTSNNKETLPNLIFDESLKDFSRIDKVIPILIKAGYVPNNIHLIWVLTKFEIAVGLNKQRDRVLRDELMLKSHVGARDSMWSVINGKVPKGINGGIYVVLNNPNKTVYFKDKKGNEVLTTGDGKVAGKTVGKKGKNHSLTISDFSYLTYKKPNKSPFKDKELRSQLYRWVIDNTPSKDRKIYE